jgi:hypothetical protein
VGLGARRSRPPVWRVPPRNPNFTGRDAMLERLGTQLAGADTVVVQALHGMGGVGKTQLAVEFAHRFASEYELVWWFDPEEPALIADQFSVLAERLDMPAGIPGPDAVAFVLDALGARDRWLLVFDNVERPEDLRPYRPSGLRGQVIVTSRHPGWGAIAGRIEVDAFSHQESVGLLQSRVAEMTVEVAGELASELGDLPLALEQAAGYIETNGTPPGRYLTLWRAERERLLGSASGRASASSGPVPLVSKSEIGKATSLR